jgi:hypothetical protein
MFPQFEVRINYKHANIETLRGSAVELDVFIPSLALGFEYQGPQHYNTSALYGNSVQQRKRDEEKKLVCKNFGVTVIDVPFWWDEKPDSLLATIHSYRPDTPNNGIPSTRAIPEKPDTKRTSTYFNLYKLY